LAAQWMIEGEPQNDMFAWDLARFGDWADKTFTKARVQDQYTHRFAIHFPNEERSAGRPARVRPAYEMQQQMGAVFGMNCGWEHPLWFADQPGVSETVGFTRQNWWEPGGREARMVRFEKLDYRQADGTRVSLCLTAAPIFSRHSDVLGSVMTIMEAGPICCVDSPPPAAFSTLKTPAGGSTSAARRAMAPRTPRIS